MTLIELLMTIAIMAAGVVGVLWALAALERTATIAEGQVQLETGIRAAADYARSSTSMWYQACAGMGVNPAYSIPQQIGTLTLPSKPIVSVAFSTAAERSRHPIQPRMHCSVNCPIACACSKVDPCDYGVQEITITLTSGSHALTRVVWKGCDYQLPPTPAPGTTGQNCS